MTTPTRHPFLEHLDRAARLEAADPHVAWTPEQGALPSLYISHGAPPVFEDRAWMEQLHGWARALPKPRAVLIVSAHWESAPLSITSTAPGTGLVHDFSGFDPAYSRMRYDTPDASELARLVVGVLPATETVHEHQGRGLDHGAWVPLKVMYPAADVPVLQLSMPTHDPVRLLELGRRLRHLRADGVLVIGSGFLTHGLPFLTREMLFGQAPAPAWSREFDAWAGEALDAGDVETLAAYRDRAPGMPYAHPTVEHYTPLFVTLGAATTPDDPARQVIDGFWMGLSKRSLQVA